MDFYQIEQILCVAKHGSITEAAKEMYITQPTMSYAISKAEQEFGVKLFDRSAYPLTLTYAGKKYVEAGLKMKSIYMDLKKVCDDAAHNAAGELRIGIPHNRSAQILPFVLQNFYDRYPNISLHYESGLAESMKDRLYNRELDFCILTKVEQDPRFHYETLFLEELRVVAQESMIADSDLVPGTTNVLKISTLSHLPLVLPEELSGLGRMLTLFLNDYDILPQIKARISGNNALYTLAAHGYAATILPQNIIEQSRPVPGIKTYSLSQPGLGWVVCAMFPRDSILSEAEKTLLTLIREQFHHYSKELNIYPVFHSQQDEDS